MKDKKQRTSFTWNDLKKIANKIPQSRLGDRVYIWDDDGGGYIIGDVEILKEDWLFDGDENSIPRSDLESAIGKDEIKNPENEYYVIHKKGTRILRV